MRARNIERLPELEVLPISSWRYPRVMLAIPIERSLHYADHTFWAFARIFAQGPSYIETKYTRHDMARIEMVRTFLTTTATHLLMLDADHIHPPNIIQRLARWALLYEDDAPIISGLNFRRKPPYDAVMGVLDAASNRPIVTEWDPGLNLVDQVGGASLLISRKVFETIPPPWFYNVYDDALAFNFPGEDIGFCMEAKKYGFPIYVDTTVSSPHMAEHAITEETFRKYLATHPQEFRNADL